jgi:multidrug efflux pump subunit AcrA (membrane-fusion protein)
MTGKDVAHGFMLACVWASASGAQALSTSAKIEAIPLELTMPDRFQVAEILEPTRKVTLIAPCDGVIRSMEARLGSAVRESQEVAELDRTEASVRVKVAEAEVKEKQALVKSKAPPVDVHEAQLDAAKARLELARLELDRCTLRAPFAGRLTALPVCAGQYVLKGTPIAELADVSTLKTIQPVDRRSVTPNAQVSVHIEDRDVIGKVQAIVPLPESYAALRELATPFAGAWVLIPNTRGELEPGFRVRSATIPVTPIASVAKRAVKHENAPSGDLASVQVIRSDYVTNVPVQVLGDVGGDRVQITGMLRSNDALVVSSSVPLLQGTYVRFGDGGGARSTDSGAPNSGAGGFDGASSNSSTTRGRPPGSAAPGRGATRTPTRPGAPTGSSDAPF